MQRFASTGDPPLPGVEQVDLALARRIAQAPPIAGTVRGRYGNRLALSSNPYLAPYGASPINWHEWSEEPLGRARTLRLPIVVSLTDSAENPVWSNPDAAALINRHSIPFKVNREEHPDIATLVDTTARITARGPDWPAVLVLSPQGEPIDPEGAEFVQALAGAATKLKEKAEAFTDQSTSLLVQIEEALGTRAPSGPVPWTRDALEQDARALLSRESLDPPKPRSPAELFFLLRHHRNTGDPAALSTVREALEQADDARTRPLSDQALRALTLLELAQATGESRIAARVDALLARMTRGGLAPSGALFADGAETTPRQHKVVFTSWNGLALSALARAGFVLDRPDYVDLATRVAEAVLKTCRGPDRFLRHSLTGERLSKTAYLDDYVFLIAGLIDLYEARADLRWIEEARALQAELDRRYADPSGGYFLTARGDEALLVRIKPAHDGSLPSANAVAALNLLRWSVLTSTLSRREDAIATLTALGQHTSSNGDNASLGCAVDFFLEGAPEIAIILPPATRNDPLVAAARRVFLPNRSLQILSAEAVHAHTHLSPFLRDMAPLWGKTTAYVCQVGRCEPPYSDPALFEKRLRQRAR